MSDPNLITQTAFAKELGVSQAYIAKLVKKRVIKLESNKVNRKKALAAMKNLSDNNPNRKSVFNTLPKSKQEQEDHNPDSLQSQLQRANVLEKESSAGLKKLAYDEKSGRLVDRNKYDEILLRMLAARDIVVKKYILSIPDRMARVWPHKDTITELKVMARKEVRTALLELSGVDLKEIEKEMKE